MQKEMYSKYLKANEGNEGIMSFTKFCDLLKSSKAFCMQWL